MSGGGVTAGIDFGLALAAELRGAEAAQEAQLIIQYDPKPPFHAGLPSDAPPAVREAVFKRLPGSSEGLLRLRLCAPTARDSARIREPGRCLR